MNWTHATMATFVNWHTVFTPFDTFGDGGLARNDLLSQRQETRSQAAWNCSFPGISGSIMVNTCEEAIIPLLIWVSLREEVDDAA